jgi:hypothetical protein
MARILLRDADGRRVLADDLAAQTYIYKVLGRCLDTYRVLLPVANMERSMHGARSPHYRGHAR